MANRKARRAAAAIARKNELPVAQGAPIAQLPTVWAKPQTAVGFKAKYNATSGGRRQDEWGRNASTAGPNAELLSQLDVLRRNARHEIQNNPIADRILTVWVSSIVGAGMRPLIPSDPALSDLWADWSEMEADAHGALSFGGIQALALRAVGEAGDCIARIRTRFPEDGLAVPMQIELMEGEFLPTLTKVSGAPAGANRIRGGVEFTPFNKRVAYHLYESHPSDAIPGEAAKLQTVRIEADGPLGPRVLHMYEPRRPGAIRGEPLITRVLQRLHDLERFEDAELVRKMINALVVTYIKTPTADANVARDLFKMLDSERATTNPAADIAPMEPGAHIVVPPGYDVQSNNPTDTGGSFAPFVQAQYRSIAAGTSIPVYLIDSNADASNDRALRVQDIAFRRRIKQVQALLVRQFLRPVWKSFLLHAQASGAWSPTEGRSVQDYFRVRWVPDTHEHLFPEQEANVLRKAVEDGRETLSEQIEAAGKDPRTVFEQAASDVALLNELGLRPAGYERSQEQAPDVGKKIDID